MAIRLRTRSSVMLGISWFTTIRANTHINSMVLNIQKIGLPRARMGPIHWLVPVANGVSTFCRRCGFISVLILLLGDAAGQWRPAIVERRLGYSSGNCAALVPGYEARNPLMGRVVADVPL